MFRSLLAWHIVNTWRGATLRAMAVAMVVVLATAIVFVADSTPRERVNFVAWTQLLSAIVLGAFLTGWRLSQWPKSRAAEFQMVTPARDIELIGGELVAGIFRTSIVVLSGAPLIALLWGLKWITAIDALALVVVPWIAGCLSGALLAVVAYEPQWVRKWLERAVLGVILVYLVALGLLGSYVLPRLLAWWSQLSGLPADALAGMGATMRYVNPFRFLGAVGDADPASMAWRLLAVTACLALAVTLCAWRLAVRLRPHYDEENYALRRRRRRRDGAVGNAPLSWWTRRRVSQFKGRINLYLLWFTVGLYAAWMHYEASWPPWLAVAQLMMIERLGGATLLLLASLQLAVVPIAFLSGLWDSTPAQRVRRLELLLVSPLAARDFLRASVVAAWTRSRGYVLAAMIMLAALRSTGQVNAAGGLLIATLAGSYLLLAFAAAFRDFAQAGTERQMAIRGLSWSAAVPLVTVLLVQLKVWPLALASPLGAIYWVTLLPDQRLAWGVPHEAAGWLMIGAAQLACCVGALALLRRTAASFDTDIRASFARHLVSGTGSTPAQPQPNALAHWLRSAWSSRRRAAA